MPRTMWWWDSHPIDEASRECDAVTVLPLQRAPGLEHRDARSDHGYLTTDACEWSQCGCFEHFEACHTPWGGGALTRSMRRVAHPTPFRFDRYNESQDLRYSAARCDHGYLTTDACEWSQCGRFEQFEACSAPWGGGALTRLMRRVAHPMLTVLVPRGVTPDADPDRIFVL